MFFPNFSQILYFFWLNTQDSNILRENLKQLDKTWEMCGIVLIRMQVTGR